MKLVVRITHFSSSVFAYFSRLVGVCRMRRDMPCEPDDVAIARDWCVVGDDLRWALCQIETELKQVGDGNDDRDMVGEPIDLATDEADVLSDP